jgi:hypothetical protein
LRPLELGRLEKIHAGFWMNVATNGLVPIPRAGFERMPIGISLCGDHETDRRLRGGGTLDVFSRALRNYRDADVGGAGGELDHRRGFDRVRREIDRMIERYPDRILMTSYLSQVVASGRLHGTGIARDCASCFDTWEHFSWIQLDLKRHLGSAGEFTRWLTTVS